MANLALMVKASKKVLKKLLCIYYRILVKKNEVQVLLNRNNEVNAMTLVFASKLDIKIRHINVKTQKIDIFILKIFDIVLASF